MEKPQRFSIYSSQELKNKYGFDTIAVITLGEVPVLIRQNSEGLLAAEPIDPYFESVYFEKEKQTITPQNQHSVAGVDVDQVGFLQVELKVAVKASWAERTIGADEITLTLGVVDTLDFSKNSFELTEEELLDLFVPMGQKIRKAAFFRIDTTKQELIGIVVRRAKPYLLFLPPLSDGSQLSPISGLVKFLDDIYTRLIEHKTDLQNQVNALVFEAMLPTKELVVFTAGASKKKHAEVHRKIYQIQALLLALRADEKLGLQDPKLLTHAPFLKPTQQKAGFGGWGGKKETTPVTTIDSHIWELLLEPVKAGFINTPPRSSKTQQPMKIATVIPSPNSRPVPTTSTPPAKVLSEKQKALTEVKELNELLSKALMHFNQMSLETIGLKQVLEFDDLVLKRIVESADRYMQKRRRGTPPTVATPSTLNPVTNVVRVGNLNDSFVFSFLTGTEALGYKEKIERAFEVWGRFVPVVFKNTSSRPERQLSQLRINPTFASRYPEIGTVLLPLFHQDVYVGELTHAILCIQIIYVLWYRLQELTKRGEAVEIDNFVTYCYGVIDRLHDISSDLLSK